MQKLDRRITLTPAETVAYERMLADICEASIRDRNDRIRTLDLFIRSVCVKNGTLIPEGYEEPV